MAALSYEFRIAFMNLLEHGRRTAFLTTAIAAVTCMFVLLAALSTGIHEALLDTAVTVATGHINVGGFFKVTSSQAGPLVSDYAAVLQAIRRSVPELDFVVQRVHGGGKLVSDKSSITTSISGIDIDAEPRFRSVVRLVDGRIEDLAQPNALLIFETQAKKLDLRVGDGVTISSQTPRGTANTVDCRVVAIAHDVGWLSSWSAFISNQTLRSLYQLRPDVTGVLQIHLKPGHIEEADKIAERLRGSLKRAGYRVMAADPRMFWMKLQTVTREEWIGQKLDVSTWEDELSMMMWTVHALHGLSVVLMLILGLIMIAGISNTLWIAIRERTREIGTLRAIGMRRAGVVRLFLLEAALLGLLGALAGVALGSVLSASINAAQIRVPMSMQLFLMRDTVQLSVDSGTVVRAVLGMTIVTGVTAIYPALRAGRRKPVDAMAHFG